jgi:integrase
VSIHRRNRKSGTVWRVQWRDERGAQRSRTFTRKADADAWDAKITLAKRQGELATLDGGKQTLKDFVSDWRSTYAEPHLAPKTLRLYDDLCSRCLLPRIGHLALRQLTTERIQSVAAEMARDKVPPATIQKALTLLQGMLERAVEWGRISSNPARYVRKPRATPRRLVEPLSPRQIEGVRRHLLAKERLRDATLISVLAYAGLRPGEALALRWGDLGKRNIRVTKALSLGEERSTKTRRNRTVGVVSPLATDLAKWRMASGRPDDEQLVFPTPAGKPWSETDYRNWRRRWFRPAAKSIGLARARPYDLRHSFASLLLAEQMNPAEIAGQLGHSLQVLFSTYAHVIEDMRGSGRVSAEAAIRAARAPRGAANVAQKLPKRKAATSPGNR